MPNSSIGTHLGANIRAMRIRRGLSSEELALRLADCGIQISGRTVRNYETGSRECSVEMMILFSIALDCSQQSLLSGLDPRLCDTDNAVEYNLLTPEEHNVFAHMATKWDGDRHALILFDALYMALPPEYRRDAPLSLLTQAELALKNGAVTRDQLPDLDYIERAWRGLY